MIRGMLRTARLEDSKEKARLEAFTDGVFAIAATLLVVNLSVSGLKDITSNADLFAAIIGAHQTLLAFAISFLVLCYLWSLHVHQFEWISGIDNTVIILNTLRLLGVVLIPFTTSLSGSFSELLLGKVLLPINVLFIGVLSAISWSYATNPKRGLSPNVPEGVRRTSSWNGLVAIALTVGVVLLAPFVGPTAFLLFLLDGLISTVTDRIVRRLAARRASADEGANDPEQLPPGK